MITESSVVSRLTIDNRSLWSRLRINASQPRCRETNYDTIKGPKTLASTPGIESG